MTHDDDPHSVVHARLRAIGQPSLLEYLRAHPREGFSALAKRLGLGVLGIQVIRAAADASATLTGDELHRYVRENLLRWIHARLPNGWTPTPGWDVLQASVIVNALRTIAPVHAALTEAAWTQLKHGKTPAGWLPADADDPVLTAALATALATS